MSDVYEEYFKSGTITADFFRLMCGDRLGSGMSREVYKLAFDDTKIVKFETGSGMFQNVLEWETWDRVKDTPEGKWLAPCHQISPCGTALVMARTKPIPDGYRLPKRVPAFLTDFKLGNYGLLNGKLVCHDYGTNLAISRGASKAMRALGNRLSS